MKEFFAYLRDRRRGIGLYLLLAAALAGTFALCALPLRAVWYPCVLCALIGAGALIRDYSRARRRHRALASLAETLTPALPDALPAPESRTEADYQALLAVLWRENVRLTAEFEARARDMQDYYTVWAHQIKTPIAAMRLALSGEDTDLARSLRSELLRVEQYADMVLVYLRLGAEGGDYVFRETALDGVIRAAARRFSAEFIRRGIRLEFTPTNLALVTDEKWLRFVLEQLLSNALKYTPAGSISIYAEGRTLCIADTGIGIAPEDLPRIFQKGYTGHNGRADQSATGLGLYLCRRVCENLGAAISAESEIGKGTVIKLDLSQYELKV